MKNKTLLYFVICVILFCNCSKEKKQYANFIKQDTSISKLQTDSTTIADLMLICKCWGFVKYFYPRIEKTGIDINDELFELFDNYCVSNNVCNVLCEWIDSIDDVGNVKWRKMPPVTIKTFRNCDLSWILDTTRISTHLSSRLRTILSYHRIRGNYSRVGNSGVIYHNTLFRDSTDLSELNNKKNRLLLLFTYWNVIEYYYCLKGPELDWNALLEDYIPSFLEGDNISCYNALISLASNLHDSHGIIRSKNDEDVRFIPLNVRYTGNELIVIGESSPNIPIGSTIISIDGRTPNSIKSLLVDTLHYNYSTFASISRAMTNSGLYSTKDSVSVTYRMNNKRYSLKIATITQEDYLQWDAKYKSGNIKDCLLQDKICYLNAGAFSRSREREYLESIKQSNLLIVDLRFYPNEMMIPFITRYLIPDNTVFAKFEMPRFNEPGSTREVLPRYKKSDYEYSGEIVILVNENTFSQGEYTAMALQANPKSITMGSGTDGSDGDMSVIFLPGGVSAYFTGIGVYYPNGDSTQRKGVRIDHFIRPQTIDKFYYNPSYITKHILSELCYSH